MIAYIEQVVGYHHQLSHFFAMTKHIGAYRESKRVYDGVIVSVSYAA